MRADVRNLLAFPTSGRLPGFQGSPALNTAYMGNVLLPVTSRNILLHAFPCCTPNAECCPQGKSGCCAHWRVDQWIKSVVQNGGADLQWFTRRRWYDQGFRPQLRSGREQGNHLWQLRRALNESGLSNEHSTRRLD